MSRKNIVTFYFDMNYPQRINVGSINPAKIEAVREIMREYPHLAESQVDGAEAPSGVRAQPLSLEETIQGAMNRARHAFVECSYSIGLESGLMAVPNTKSGHMDVCACAIYDGTEFHLGLSSAWEFPDPRVTHLMLNEGLDMNEAVHRMGLTANPNVGSAEGAIGILTKGRLTRKEYTKQALRAALIHLESKSD